MSFRTGQVAGDATPFSFGIVADMGYVNAKATHEHLLDGALDDFAFIFHAGDISYADDWDYPLLTCAQNETGTRCYNGSSSVVAYPDFVDNPYYLIPLPEGEVPSMGTIWGGEGASSYERT
jgi:hypothetical protein